MSKKVLPVVAGAAGAPSKVAKVFSKSLFSAIHEVEDVAAEARVLPLALQQLSRFYFMASDARCVSSPCCSQLCIS